MQSPSPTPLYTQLKWITQFHGPNPLAGGAVVVAQLTITPPIELAALEAAIGHLWQQAGMVCMTEEPERAVDRADPPLYLAQALADWALAFLNEVRGDLQQAGARRVDGGICVWLGFHQPDVSRAAMALALKSLIRILRGDADSTDSQAERERLWALCRQHHPDYQAAILMRGARAMGVPCLPFLPGTRCWQYGWGSKARVFMESSSNADGLLGFQWQRSKVISKALMAGMGLPVPKHQLVSREQDVAGAVARVGLPCVVKPSDRGGGKGVTAHIGSVAAARAAFADALQLTQEKVIVEQHVPGDDHRLMLVGARLVAVIRRVPSSVVGDGVAPLSVLVGRLNASRSHNMVRSRYLRPVSVDDVLQQHLTTQSLSLDDVPAHGQRVTLRSNANLSTGGICTDVTAVCHPQVRAMAEQLARTSGLQTMGVDYLTTDITRSAEQTGGAFIEMNAFPGLDVCLAAGWSEISIARLVLGPRVGRIPIELTVLSAAGLDRLRQAPVQLPLADGDARVVGDRLHVGGLRLPVVTSEPWAAVQASLRNQTVSQVHVICSADDLYRFGLPVECIDRATITVSDSEAVLSQVWREVLARYSKNPVACETEAAVLGGLMGTGDGYGCVIDC